MSVLSSLKQALTGARLQPAPTRRQWFLSPLNVQRLREIATDPVFIAACNLLLDEQRPTRYTVNDTVDTELLARRCAFDAGYSSFLRDLESLTSFPASVTQAELEEWAHITTPKP